MAKLVHLAFASVFVTFGAHLNVALREAKRSIVFVERVIAAVENVQFRVCESWIASFIYLSVMPPYVLGPGIQLADSFMFLGATTDISGARCTENSQCNNSSVRGVTS